MRADQLQPPGVVIDAQPGFDVLQIRQTFTRGGDPFDGRRQECEVFIHLPADGTQGVPWWTAFFHLQKQVFFLRHERGQRVKVCRYERPSFLIQDLVKLGNGPVMQWF